MKTLAPRAAHIHLNEVTNLNQLCCCSSHLFHLSNTSVYPLTPSSLAPGWLDGSRGKSSEPMPGKEPSAWATAEFCEHLTIIFRHCACLQGNREEKKRILARVLKKYTARSGRLHCHSDREPCAYVYIHATHTHTHIRTRTQSV